MHAAPCVVLRPKVLKGEHMQNNSISDTNA